MAWITAESLLAPFAVSFLLWLFGGFVFVAPVRAQMSAQMNAADWYNRGMAEVSQGTIADAIVDFTHAIELDPKLQAAYMGRGAAELKSGKLLEAIEDFSRAIALNPTDAHAYANRCNAKQSTGDADGAIADCSRALDLDPKTAFAYLGLGNAYEMKGDLDRALAEMDHAIEIDPQVAKAFYNRGRIWYAKGDQAQAIKDYTRAIELDPQLAEAYLNRGNAEGDRGDFGHAIADYDRAIAIAVDSSLILAYAARGKVKRLEHNPQGAIEDFDRAIEKNPEFAQPYWERALARIEMGDRVGAIDDFTRVIEKCPKGDARNRVAKVTLSGVSANQCGIVSNDPGLALAYFDRGSVKNQNGDLTGAKADLEESLRINPQFPQAYDALAWLLATAKNPLIRDGGRAVVAARRACELTQWKDARYLSTLAAAYARNGEFANAVQWEQKAMTDPRFARSESEQRQLRAYQAGSPWPVE